MTDILARQAMPEATLVIFNRQVRAMSHHYLTLSGLIGANLRQLRPCSLVETQAAAILNLLDTRPLALGEMAP